MKKNTTLYLIMALALTILVGSGCAKKPAATDVTAPPSAEEQVVTETPSDQEVSGIDEEAVTEAPVDESRLLPQADTTAPELQRIFFDFDQYTLTPQARETLAENAAYIKAHPQYKVRIEGHCDERGSDEYNLALGERRAKAAQDYLETLGVDADRLSTISYGEEMPLDKAHNEAAWAKNRRAEFNVINP